MATITLTTTNTCAGGDHVRLSVTGDITYVINSMYLPNLADPINDEDREVFFRLLLKLAKRTRTANQMRTVLSTGLTVTI